MRVHTSWKIRCSWKEMNIKWGNHRWLKGMAHILKGQRGQNGASIEWVTRETELRTSYKLDFEYVETRSLRLLNARLREWGWECTSCHDKGSKGNQWWNSGSWMALRTSWEFALVETSHYRMKSPWNVITHGLRVRIGRSGVSIKLARDGMALRTFWELKLVEMKSVSD